MSENWAGCHANVEYTLETHSLLRKCDTCIHNSLLKKVLSWDLLITGVAGDFYHEGTLGIFHGILKRDEGS